MPSQIDKAFKIFVNTWFHHYKKYLHFLNKQKIKGIVANRSLSTCISLPTDRIPTIVVFHKHQLTAFIVMQLVIPTCALIHKFHYERVKEWSRLLTCSIIARLLLHNNIFALKSGAKKLFAPECMRTLYGLLWSAQSPSSNL